MTRFNKFYEDPTQTESYLNLTIDVFKDNLDSLEEVSITWDEVFKSEVDMMRVLLQNIKDKRDIMLKEVHKQ